MKKFLAVLSTTAILTTSFAAMANEEAMANAMARFETESSRLSASNLLLNDIKDGLVTSADIKTYLKVNVGPKANKAIALIEKAELGLADKSTVAAEFQSALSEMNPGAHFLGLGKACDPVGWVSLWITIGSGVATLVYGINAAGVASDIRSAEVEIRQAQMRIEQIKAQPEQEAVTSSSSSSGSSAVNAGSAGSASSSTTTTTTVTYVPPTKAQLIAAQQKIIDNNNVDLISKNSEYDHNLVMTGVSSATFLLGAGVLAGCSDQMN